MDELNKIERMMCSSKRIEPPEDFTGMVMEKLPERVPGRLALMGKFLRQPIPFRANSEAAIDEMSAKTRECVFSFFITAFCYLILSLIFFLGYTRGYFTTYSFSGLMLQPALYSLIALWLVMLGVSLFAAGGRAVLPVRIGVLVYMSLCIVNAVILKASLPWRIAAIVTIIFTVKSIAIGYLLTQSVSKLHKNSTAGIRYNGFNHAIHHGSGQA